MQRRSPFSVNEDVNEDSAPEQVDSAKPPSQWLRKAIIRLLVFVVGIVVIGRLASSFTAAPELGVRGGKLAKCPDSPNCVSSQADPNDPHFVDGLFFPKSQEVTKQSFNSLVESIKKMPRCKLIHQSESYARFEFRSLVFGYVDDVEIQTAIGSRTIDIRSSSRLGYSDLGANRSRVEKIRELFLATVELHRALP